MSRRQVTEAQITQAVEAIQKYTPLFMRVVYEVIACVRAAEMTSPGLEASIVALTKEIVESDDF